MAEKNNKIASLNTEYAKQQYAEFQQKQKQLIFRRRRLFAMFLGALIVFAIIGVQLFSDFQRLEKLNTIHAETQIEEKEVTANMESLKQEVSLLKDNDYIAKLARSRYFYSKEGEQVYPILDSSVQDSDKEDQAADKSSSSTTAE